MFSVDVDSFSELPREIQVLILGRLGLHDQLVMMRVSRFLYNLVRSTPALQYPIELVACGMLDNTQSVNSVGERLANLRQHDQAWRTLHWSHDVRFGIPSDGRIECKQGLIVFTKERLHPEKGVEVMQVPSSARNVAFRRWTIEPGQDHDSLGPGHIYDVDASQDLLIIRHGSAPSFNIYTLSEGLPHPQAARRRFHISNSGVLGAFNTSIAGAYVRREWIYLFDEAFEFYNWKSGERIRDYDRHEALTECVFLNDRFIATVSRGVGTSPAVLLVQELPSSDPEVLPLYPTNFPSLALFLLPEIDSTLAEDMEWELIGGSAQSAAQGSRTSGGDFSTGLDQTLLLIHFRVTGLDYELVVPTQRILDLLPHPDDISISPGGFSPLDLAWSEWGPRCTHVRPCAPSGGDRERLQASVFGMRHVLHHPVEWNGKIVIRVNDYQPSRVHRAEANQTPSCIVRRAHLAAGDWLNGGGDMHTELPYVETNVELPESWRGKEPPSVLVSINEDGILLIDKESGEIEHGEAYTF